MPHNHQQNYNIIVNTHTNQHLNEINNNAEFINTLIMEEDPHVQKIKKKVAVVKNRVVKKKGSTEPIPLRLRLPEFADYADFVKHEYKVSELKEMCKHHGIKCGGTKQDLKLRMHAH